MAKQSIRAFLEAKIARLQKFNGELDEKLRQSEKESELRFKLCVEKNTEIEKLKLEITGLKFEVGHYKGIEEDRNDLSVRNRKLYEEIKELEGAIVLISVNNFKKARNEK